MSTGLEVTIGRCQIKNNYSNNAPKLHAEGLSPIPCSGKQPVVNDWSKFSDEPMTYEELDLYVEQYPNHNVGLVLGQVVCVLDIDTDNPDVIASAPPSPIVRYGRKGLVLFYKANFMPTEKAADVPIDFLNHGCQVIVHGRHPKGAMYKLEQNVPWDQLPELTPSDLKRVQDACRKAGVKREIKLVNGEMTGSGRNDQLIIMCWAKANEGVEMAQAVDELLACEAGSWFRDSTEPHRGKNPRKSAEKMYKKALDKVGEVPELIIDLKPKVAIEAIPYPEPTGIIKLFRDYCDVKAKYSQDILGLGGGIALMSVLSGNRVVSQFGKYTITPNLYIFNLAESGFGKETCQNILSELLGPRGLLGASSYKSGRSLIENLPKQQVRLDMSDECSSFIKTMASPEDFKSEQVEIYSSLFSKASTYYEGISTVGNQKSGSCHQPHVSFLGSTTPTGFRESVTSSMASKGLLPRFIIFYGVERGDLRQFFDYNQTKELKSELLKFVNNFLKLYPLVESDENDFFDANQPFCGKIWDPKLIPPTQEAMDLFLKLERDIHDYTGNNDLTSIERSFYERFVEIGLKLALIAAVSQGMNKVGAEHVQWGYDVVKTSWEASKSLYALALSENENQRYMRRVEEIVLKNDGWMSRTDLYRKTSFIRGGSRQRDDVIKQLLEEGTFLSQKESAQTFKKPLTQYIHRTKV